jgi:hypothetical protein
MQYLLLIYGPDQGQSPSADGAAQMSAEYAELTASLRADGSFVAGEALHPVATATTVRVRDGQTLTTDGPFAETKEVLGGFYLLEAADLDAAIGYAARIPGARFGSVEIRPIVVWAADPAAEEAVGAAAN